MKRFIHKLTVFCFFVFCAIVLVNFAINKIIDTGNYFAIPENKEYIILGHSAPACAFNDSLINNFWNVAEPMEGYFYTYFKAKKILENNKQVKAVFIEYANNQVGTYADGRVWGEYLPNNLPKVAAFLNYRALLFLFSKNPIEVIKSYPVIMKRNFFFLINEKKNYPLEYWNSTTFIEHELTKRDTIAQPQITYARTTGAIKGNYGVSESNIWYLAKTVKMCNDHHVKVYFVRSPKPYSVRCEDRECLFKEILQEEFNDIPFLDFAYYPLANNEFADRLHLNNKGSNKFSLFFNSLIKEGLLEAENKQEFIDSKMKN